jgi:hypothetical protein
MAITASHDITTLVMTPGVLYWRDEEKEERDYQGLEETR